MLNIWYLYNFASDRKSTCFEVFYIYCCADNKEKTTSNWIWAYAELFV